MKMAATVTQRRQLSRGYAERYLGMVLISEFASLTPKNIRFTDLKIVLGSAATPAAAAETGQGTAQGAGRGGDGRGADPGRAESVRNLAGRLHHGAGSFPAVPPGYAPEERRRALHQGRGAPFHSESESRGTGPWLSKRGLQHSETEHDLRSALRRRDPDFRSVGNRAGEPFAGGAGREDLRQQVTVGGATSAGAALPDASGPERAEGIAGPPPAREGKAPAGADRDDPHDVQSGGDRRAG